MPKPKVSVETAPYLGILRVLLLVEVLLQLPPVYQVEVVGDRFVRPGHAPLERRELGHVHDRADV